MKKQLIIQIGVLVLIITNCINAQNLSLDWVKQIGGTDYDASSSLTIDNWGNVYTTGWFYGTADFDPGPDTFNLMSAGETDIYIQKLDAAGNFVWVRQLGGTDYEWVYSIAVDNEGNVYTTGIFIDTIDFDPGPEFYYLYPTEGGDGYIQKLDPNGNFLWVKQLGGTSGAAPFSITLDIWGSLYITGSFGKTIDFDPGLDTFLLSSIQFSDIYILKLSPEGNFVWAKQIGGTGIDRGWYIEVDELGYVYITGHFDGTTDFDPGQNVYNLTSAGNPDIFVQKLDSSGNFIWANRMGSTGVDRGNSIAIDDLGNVFSTGNFQGTVDFDPGPGTFNISSEGDRDFYIQKLDASGNFVWAIGIGGQEDDRGNSIALDPLGNVYITGRFEKTVDFDPGPATFNLTSNGASDMYLLILDTNSNLIWTGQIGGEGLVFGESITLDATGNNIYIAGRFSKQTDFDPGQETYYLLGNDFHDIFVLKMSQCLGIADISSDNLLEICEGESISLMANLGLNYLWSSGETSQSIIASPLSTTDFTVTVSYADDCTGTNSITIFVNNLPEISINGESELCPGDTTILTASGGENYFWSTGSNSNEIQVSPLIASVYTVTVTDENDCSTVDSVSVITDDS